MTNLKLSTHHRGILGFKFRWIIQKILVGQNPFASLVFHENLVFRLLLGYFAP